MENKKCIEYIAKFSNQVLDEELLLDKDGKIAIYYAPFDYINKKAKVVLVGITPGAQQANNALQAGKEALMQGKQAAEVLKIAKETGSFSGPMRNNLIEMLNYFKINDVLGIKNCASLFGVDKELVHYTSCLRYPVFVDGKNYNGTPNATKNKLLQKYLKQYLGEELKQLDNAIIIPLGGKVSEYVKYLAEEGYVKEDNVLIGFQHPSGANNERISYLIGKKAKELCSIKTNTDMIDADRKSLQKKLKKFLQCN